MQLLSCFRRCKRAFSLLGLSGMIFTSTLVFSPFQAMAAEEYTELVINPQNVGVFLSVGQQQFTAWGRTGPGPEDWKIINDEVSWISSDTDIVTIDETGLAKAVRSWGSVTITAKYPKDPTVNFGAIDQITSFIMRQPLHYLMVQFAEGQANGGGTVTADKGYLNCTANCREDYVSGTTVKLTATPDANSYFRGWSVQECNDQRECTVTLSGDMTVTADFGAVSQVQK